MSTDKTEKPKRRANPDHVRAQLAHWKKHPPTRRNPDDDSWKAWDKALEDMRAAKEKS